jgi:MATE family multidrug resistance protein
MGVLQALLPVWAELHGGQRHAEVGRSVRQAAYLAVIASVAGVFGLLFPNALLHATGVPPLLQQDVRHYLGVLALALPPALLFRMYSTLNQGLGKPQLVTWLQLASLVLKVPLTIWFAFGGAGMPAMGAVGCAWATVVVNYVFLAVALWLVRTDAFYRPYAIWRPLERPHWPTIRQFAGLGIPRAWRSWWRSPPSR